MSFSPFDFRPLRNAAAAGALLLLPALAHADSAPFANYAGNWSGNGSITIAEGGTERIRCRGTYTANNGGNNLHLSLRCASDSYKFDLSSDVVSEGDEITGNWSEASRNVFGSVRGRAGGGEIQVFVEAAGFAANLTLRANGNKQSVSITSKGEIRGVSITMVRS